MGKKKYYLDTNVLLRFILQDDRKFFGLAKDILTMSKNGEVDLIVATEVFIEMDYVLRKVYEVEREKVFQILSMVNDLFHLHIPDRHIIKASLDIYKSVAIDLSDILLFVRAKFDGCEVFSFDDDFRKLGKVDL